ncbi:MAG: glycosyltransferase family 8 protein [Bacteroidaceae bacterium]|nr:glycosyltransferase family 8 protein [Bacteroidaceae bacterium]
MIFSSDNNYAQHLGVAIYSLLYNNKWSEHTVVYIIENLITETNKKKIEKVVSLFNNAEIRWITFDRWKEQLDLSMTWPISLSAYARLFVDGMLPLEVEKVLYLDCDMIVNASLYELWNLNLNDAVLAAVQDCVSDGIKNAVEVDSTAPYFNSGLLMINLRKWREDKIGERCVNYIYNKKGEVLHHDQGVLNGILQNKWIRLPLKYNVMTICYILSRKNMMKYYGEHAVYYSKEEIESAKEKPIIIHYTPSFTSRPWIKNCKHPLKYLYWNYLFLTPWKDVEPVRDTASWYVRLINWMFRNFMI